MRIRQFVFILGSISIACLFPGNGFCATRLTGEWSFIGGSPSCFPGIASLAKGNGDTLFAGGDSGVAVWTGRQWISISNTPVYRIVYAKGLLYVIGDFSRISSTVGCPGNNVAKWDNKKWLPLGAGVHTSASHGIKGVAVSPDGSLHIGGDIDSVGGVPAHYYALWNGASWDTSDGGQFSGSVDALAFANDGTMYAAIETMIKQKKGNAWSDITPTLRPVSDWPLETNAMTVDSNGTLFVGGAFPNLNNENIFSGVIKWDGSSWTSAGAISMRVTDVAVSSTGTVFAVGSDDYSIVNTRQNDVGFDYKVFRINNTTIDTPYAKRIVMSTVTGTVPLIRCSLAPGIDSTFQVNCGDGIINHSRGSNVLLRSGLYEWIEEYFTYSTYFGKITALSSDNRDFYVCGQYLCYNGNYLNSLAKYDGFAWNKIECGDAYIEKIQPCTDGGLTVSGTFSAIGGIPATVNPLDTYGINHGEMERGPQFNRGNFPAS